MGSPFTTAAICLTYVYIVKVLGPRVMENRKPYNLRTTLIYYNLFQVIFSTWLFYEVHSSRSAPPPRGSARRIAAGEC